MANGNCEAEGKLYDAELGRELWHKNNYSRSYGHVNDSHIVAYLRQQRERVERTGECEGGCDRTKLIEHYATGKIVCPLTLEPCKRRDLAGLVFFYSRINDDSSTDR